MSVETLKTAFIYATAMLVALGGLVFLYFSRLDTTGADLRVIVAGFIGAALQFLFGSSIAAQTARQTTTVTNGESPTTTVGFE